MRIIRIKEEVPEGGIFRLHHLTDTHCGAPDFQEEALRARVKLIEDDPYSRWTFGGDGGELIRHNDRRYSPEHLAARYRAATDIRYATLEHLLDLLKPIASKCWGWCDGNHERKLDKVYGGKFGVECCANLGIPELWVGTRGLLNITWTREGSTRRLAQLIDLHHGWQAGRLRGAFHLQAEREISATDAAVVLRGHSHKPDGAIFKTLTVSTNTKRAIWRLRTVINGGCWVLGYRDGLASVNVERLSEVEDGTWAESMGFRAETIGGPVLLLRFDFGTAPSGGGGGFDGRNAMIDHSLVKGEINEHTLGLA